MATGDRNDPFAQFNFLIELDGLDVAGFTEASGLTAESDVVDYREGSDPPFMRKLPGLLKYTNIVLKRGFTKNDLLWAWRKTTLDGKTERRDGSIVLLDEARQEVLRWNFRNGWVSKYEGPQLNSKTNEIAIESIEIAHEGLELA
jgi:phage tail-like protein